MSILNVSFKWRRVHVLLPLRFPGDIIKRYNLLFCWFFSFPFSFSLFAWFLFWCRAGERCFPMLSVFVLRSWLVSWQFDPIEKWKIQHSVYSQTKACQAREMYRLPGGVNLFYTCRTKGSDVVLFAKCRPAFNHVRALQLYVLYVLCEWPEHSNLENLTWARQRKDSETYLVKDECRTL